MLCLVYVFLTKVIAMFAGVSRSVSVVIMHFIGKYHMHLKNAYNHIHAARYVLLAIRLSSLLANFPNTNV